MKKKRILGSAVLSLAMGVSMFATGAFGAGVQESQDTYRVLVKGPSAEQAKVKEQYGKRWDFGKQGFTTEVNSKQYQALLKNKNIEISQVEQYTIDARVEGNSNGKGKGDYTAQASYPSDQTPWGIQAIYNDNYIQATSGGDGIKVAVLDTGINRNHIDLTDNVEQCKDFTQSYSSLVNGSCTDRQGHGTHVAGTAVANGGYDGAGVYGVAPDAELWGYKVLGDNGSGYSDDIAGAIRHAADEGVRTGSKVVISLSLGSSGKDSMIASAVDYAYSKGALVVAAAGNSGPSANTIGYPGALTNAIAVASLDNTFVNGTHKVSDFSSRGNPYTDGDYYIQERDVEVSAPGGGIYSTAVDGNYATMSGTSMATPHISGLAAKLWSSNKYWSNSQLRYEIQRRAKLYDIKGGTGAATGDDYASGFGFPRVR